VHATQVSSFQTGLFRLVQGIIESGSLEVLSSELPFLGALLDTSMALKGMALFKELYLLLHASSCQVATVCIECGTCNETGITGHQQKKLL